MIIAKYKIIEDGIYSSIEKVDPNYGIEADGYRYFASFKLAKKHLKENARYMVLEWQETFSQINRLKESDIK